MGELIVPGGVNQKLQFCFFQNTFVKVVSWCQHAGQNLVSLRIHLNKDIRECFSLQVLGSSLNTSIQLFCLLLIYSTKKKVGKIRRKFLSMQVSEASKSWEAAHDLNHLLKYHSLMMEPEELFRVTEECYFQLWRELEIHLACITNAQFSHGMALGAGAASE